MRRMPGQRSFWTPGRCNVQCSIAKSAWKLVDRVANKIWLRGPATPYKNHKSSNVQFFHLVLPLSNCFESRPNLGHQDGSPAEYNQRSKVSAMVWNRSTSATGRCEFVDKQKIVKQRKCIVQGARLSIVGLTAIAATSTKRWPWSRRASHQQLHNTRTRSSKRSALRFTFR